jgi:hypothetical protein
MSPSHKPSILEDEIFNDLYETSNAMSYSFIHPETKRIVTVPVWLQKYNNKFYIFGSRKRLKCRSLDEGFDNVGLLIVNMQQYPHPDENAKNSYLSISGKAKIVSFQEVSNISDIHLALLQKYNQSKINWIENLIQKLKSNPELAWLIEITPEMVYTYM